MSHVSGGSQNFYLGLTCIWGFFNIPKLLQNILHAIWLHIYRPCALSNA
jgi:hypothetical protein